MAAATHQILAARSAAGNGSDAPDFAPPLLDPWRRADVHRSCSMAAAVARSTLTGRRIDTNGWTFWQYRDGDGRPRELAAARNEYLLSRGVRQSGFDNTGSD